MGRARVAHLWLTLRKPWQDHGRIAEPAAVLLALAGIEDAGKARPPSGAANDQGRLRDR
jgi:hypothetical protein